MSLYIFIYFLYISFFLIISFFIYKKYIKYLYWKYLFSWIIVYSFWLLIYLLAFTSTNDKNILLYLSRILYFFSLIWPYLMIIFVIYFFNNYSKSIIKKINYTFIITFLFLFFISIFSDLIIKDMIYNSSEKFFYEDFWILFNLYTILYLISPILFIFLVYKKNKNIHWISKLRFNYIVFWFWTFLLSWIFIYVILPIFWIWILQKEQFIIFTSFLLWTFYSLYKYYSTNIKIWLWKIIIYILSILCSILFVFIFINLFQYYISILNNIVLNFWQQWNNTDKSDLFVYFVITIISFSYFHKLFNKKFRINTELDQLKLKLSKLKSQIFFISDFKQLNNFLKKEVKRQFNIKCANIKLFTKKEKNLEIYKYFEKDIWRNLFINDIIFLEENKHKFDIDLVKQQIDKKIYLIFPLINNKMKLIWIYELWTKPFKDQYQIEQIEIIKNFINFLVWHLKYLRIYEEINDLNLNLEKKVDEKTIEYNTLLNKQKEFIWMTSHEVKMPITNAIFQMDFLVDEFDEWNHDDTYFSKQLSILSEQLIKLWELVNTIFKVEKYDIKEIKLFIETINLNKLILKEIKRFKRVNKKSEINLKIDDEIWYVEIDKVQFIQVIDNLLNNAIKFSSKNNSKINIICRIVKKYIIIKIEDNWIWFKNINIKNIFWKYETGWAKTIWMWLWLYLCSKIISMHNWTIKAKKSKILWWASFIIELPIKHKLKK